MNCKYNMFIPSIGICCGAYAESARADGKYWAHFPICTEANCPLVHSELLEGAILENENGNKIDCDGRCLNCDYYEPITSDCKKEIE